MAEIGINKQFIEEESWLRQPGETNAAYYAFCLYRDYGGDRSIVKVLDYQNIPRNKGSLWRCWSSKYQWVRRTGDYDNHLDQIRLKENEITLREREKKHRTLTEKMVQIIERRLDKFDPEELSQNNIMDWIKGCVEIELDSLGKEDKTEKSDQLQINFFNEFDGV